MTTDGHDPSPRCTANLKGGTWMSENRESSDVVKAARDFMAAVRETGSYPHLLLGLTEDEIDELMVIALLVSPDRALRVVAREAQHWHRTLQAVRAKPGVIADYETAARGLALLLEPRGEK